MEEKNKISDEVKIEIVNAVKEVLLKLIDYAFLTEEQKKELLNQ